MAKIEWTDRSDWNPIRGCTRVSPGCGGPGPHGGCYAEAIAGRFSDPGQAFHGFATRTAAGGRWTGKVELMEDRLTLPLRWRKPAKVFASSTSDIFHEALSDEDIDRIFAVMAMAPHLTFQVLTKRADRMRSYLNQTTAPGRIFGSMAGLWPGKNSGLHFANAANRLASPDGWPLPNVWIGVSVEDQQRARERVPYLLTTPAAIRFLSCEPLLGPVDLTDVFPDITGRMNALTGEAHHLLGMRGQAAQLDWVIVGGESGPRARDNDFLTNAWSLLGQCQRAGVAYFGKQGYRKKPLPAGLDLRQFPA